MNENVYFLGIDIGSSATKAVLLNMDGEIVDCGVIQQAVGSFCVDDLIDEIVERHEELKTGTVLRASTGYGRLSVRGIEFQKSEISCHAKGVFSLIPEVRTIIDIGGQDIKVISVSDTGNINEFVMNDKCAAGTGRFLEVMSKVLNVELSEMGDIGLRSEEPVTISNTCTVFAESEVISCLSRGESLPDIVAGIHASVASKAASLAKRLGVREKVAFTGGVAQNKGVLEAIQNALQLDIQVPGMPQYTGALGAAIFCRESYLKKNA